ncbi:MAG: transglycosylase SLT domain-containing protein [Gemmatimonadetes bacterium]|nr:transglycosylase SLT domain-containing protein [Gemmatimonadota bacterium]
MALLFLPSCASAPESSETVAAPEAAPRESATDPIAAAEVPSAAPTRDILPTADARARGVAEFRRALELQRARDVAGAVRALDEAAEHLPLMRSWSHLLAAEAGAQIGDTAMVRRRLSAADPVRAREWGWQIRERAYRSAGDATAARRATEAAASGITDAGRRAAAWRLVGESRASAGDPAGALAAYREAMAAAPQTRSAREAAAALAELPRTPADRLLEGRVWLRHGNVERGIAGFDAFLAAGEGSPAERAEIRLQAGRALFNARRYAQAESYLLAAARETAAAPAVASEAMFLASRSQFRDGRTDLSRRTFAATADRFPTQPSAARALFILGDLEHDAGRLESARAYFRRAIDSQVDADEVVLAATRLAGMQFVERDYRGAAGVLDRAAAGRPTDRHLAQLHYWAARAYLAAGDRETGQERLNQAIRAEPVSYYGALAAVRLGAQLADLPLVAAPTIESAVENDVVISLFRVDLLRELSLADAAAFEMEIARSEAESRPGALYLIAESLIENGQPVAGMLLGREIHRREAAWNPRLLRIVYPFPHRALIEAEARRHSLDPFMVAGLIRQESMFNPIAVSPAGAIGLMQVMPATGQMLARRAGISGFDAATLRRPEVNVRLGTLFLADLLSRSGNRTEAFAAYNAGPSRAARWRAFPEYRDEELFAERIPFTETRDYVKILNFNARIYQTLYGNE